MTLTLNGTRAGALGPFGPAECQLSDRDIRLALSSTNGPLQSERQGELLEEVRLWRGHVRADYVLWRNNLLSVVEIKSDRDTLKRFEEQARVYSSFADHVVLVVGWSLAVAALRAAPSWWDVWLAERAPGGETAVVPIRDGKRNPEAQPLSLARLLPVETARSVAAAAGLPEFAKTTLHSRDLRKALAEHLTGIQLRQAVAEWLKQLSTHRKQLSRQSHSELQVEAGGRVMT